MSKTCSRCNRRTPLERFSEDPRYKGGRSSWCRDCQKTYAAEWQQKNKRKRLAQSREWDAKNRERRKEINRASALRRYRRIKAKVFKAYGGRCECCGESSQVFLAIDHVDGGGNEHRRLLNLWGSARFYGWLVKNDFPDGFQVLCHNCNFAKSNGGCPHESLYRRRNQRNES